jgi:hypothetical protein
LRDVVELAHSHAPRAIDTLAEIMSNQEAPPAARVVAANAILDRGCGKPKETVDANVSWSLEDLILEAKRNRERRTIEEKAIGAKKGSEAQRR